MADFKKFISNILLAGAAAALIAFLVSLFLPKYWQVSGRIVVFPSGKPVSSFSKSLRRSRKHGLDREQRHLSEK